MKTIKETTPYSHLSKKKMFSYIEKSLSKTYLKQEKAYFFNKIILTKEEQDNGDTCQL